MIDIYQIAAEITAAHEAVVTAESPALAYAKRCGDLLIKAKKQITHGGWMPFVKQWCGMKTRTAAEYMMLAGRWHEIQISGGAANLSIREALALLPKVRTRRKPAAPRLTWKDLTTDERREVRRITVEMDQFRYTSRTFNERPEDSGWDIVAGCGGAPVYWEIVGGNPDGGRPVHGYTRGEVWQKLEEFVDGGPRSLASDLAVDVAKRRLAGDRTLSRPLLPPLDDRATVTLSTKTQEQCSALASMFNTRTLEETVAAAVEFVHAQLDDMPECFSEIVTPDYSDPIGQHDEEMAAVS